MRRNHRQHLGKSNYSNYRTHATVYRNVTILLFIFSGCRSKNRSLTTRRSERHATDLLFQTEITRRSGSYPDFTYTNVITSEEGRLSKDKLTTLVSNAQHQHACICGPAQFMQDMTNYLVAMGVAPGNIYTEHFDF